jgi:hypothetical protein
MTPFPGIKVMLMHFQIFTLFCHNSLDLRLAPVHDRIMLSLNRFEANYYCNNKLSTCHISSIAAQLSKA